MNDQSLAVTLLVIEVFDQLQIPYLIGGSLASAIHGVARTTLDSDLVADMRVEHLQPFIDRLKTDFYIPVDSLIDAIIQRSSFNLIHLESMFKVDIFLPKERTFDQLQFANRTAVNLPDEPTRTIYLASPEDTILAKLEWYRMGGEISERQWRDILGVIQVQRERLDFDYLRQLALEMKINDLLEKAIAA